MSAHRWPSGWRDGLLRAHCRGVQLDRTTAAPATARRAHGRAGPTQRTGEAGSDRVSSVSGSSAVRAPAPLPRRGSVRRGELVLRDQDRPAREQCAVEDGVAHLPCARHGPPLGFPGLRTPPTRSRTTQSEPEHQSADPATHDDYLALGHRLHDRLAFTRKGAGGRNVGRLLSPMVSMSRLAVSGLRIPGTAVVSCRRSSDCWAAHSRRRPEPGRALRGSESDAGVQE